MTSNEFAASLLTISGLPTPPPPRNRAIRVLVSNADRHRPSAVIIEFEGTPPFSLLMSNLQADYVARTLIVGRHVWPAGDRSLTKHRLSDLIDTYLATLGVELNSPLPRPLCYVGNGS